MTIDCAFYGFLAADADARTSQAGKEWVRLRVGVGKDDAVQWVSVAVFGSKAVAAAAELKKGDRCYIEGNIRIDAWRSSDGVERHGLSVAAFKCERTHNIGRNRPKKDDRGVSVVGGSAAARSTAARGGGGDFHNDEIPF
jgi:single-stranded DNA-binding protein